MQVNCLRNINGLNEVIRTVHESIECGGGSSLAQTAALARGHAGQVGVAVGLGQLVALRLLVAAEHRHPLLAPVLHQRQRRDQAARSRRSRRAASRRARGRGRGRGRALTNIYIIIYPIKTYNIIIKKFNYQCCYLQRDEFVRW